MWHWWYMGAIFAAQGAVALSGLRGQRRRHHACRGTVESCGFQVVSTSRPSAYWLRIEARSGPVSVKIEDIRKRNRDFGMMISMTFPGLPGFPGVKLRREVYKPRGAREVEIGDESFDSAFFVEGPVRLLSVLLDADARRLLLEVDKEGRLGISGGEIRLETWERNLASHLLHLLDIARRFSEPADVAERLTENARQDPEAGVRLHNLLLLAREFPGEPGTVETLRSALSDPSSQVRLRAALALGGETRDILLGVAESLEDDDSGALAVQRLGRELPDERLRAILSGALRKRLLQTARACLESLGRGEDPTAVDTLEKVLAVEKGELAAAAAQALGDTSSPDAEPPLLEALRRDKMKIRVAAANALRRAGSAAAVLPLKEASESTRDPDLRRATRQAIAEIQSRLQGASPGQLSLAGGETGQLSLAATEGGELSLASDPNGRA